MGWGAYDLSQKRKGRDGGIVVFPVGTVRDDIVAALGETARTWDLGNFFAGRYLYDAAQHGRYVFAPQSLALRIEVPPKHLMELSRALVSSLGIQAVLVLIPNASDFYLVEQSAR